MAHHSFDLLTREEWSFTIVFHSTPSLPNTITLGAAVKRKGYSRRSDTVILTMLCFIPVQAFGELGMMTKFIAHTPYTNQKSYDATTHGDSNVWKPTFSTWTLSGGDGLTSINQLTRDSEESGKINGSQKTQAPKCRCAGLIFFCRKLEIDNRKARKLIGSKSEIFITIGLWWICFHF